MLPQSIHAADYTAKRLPNSNVGVLDVGALGIELMLRMFWYTERGKVRNVEDRWGRKRRHPERRRARRKFSGLTFMRKNACSVLLSE